jgi:hypothetical protein
MFVHVSAKDVKLGLSDAPDYFPLRLVVMAFLGIEEVSVEDMRPA